MLTFNISVHLYIIYIFQFLFQFNNEIAKKKLFQQRDVRQHSPMWAIIKSTRHDESNENEVRC